ncbi:MAG: ATP-dependent DNA helicase RecG, partial [Candidatus Eiseniibacteriota bacterium]
AGAKLVDLLWHLPTGIIDRRYSPKIMEAEPGRIATMVVRIDAHIAPPNRRLPYKVRCVDDTGFLHLVYFHANADYLKRALPEGETRVVSGKVDHFNNEVQITHPDYVGTLEELETLRAVEPVYPLTAGLTPKTLAKAIKGALDKAPDLEEWIDAATARQQGWPAWRAALRLAHAPQAESDLAPTTPQRRRLAYDELLASQLAITLVRGQEKKLKGRVIKGDGRLRAKALTALPYSLTNSQKTAIDEILADMAGEHRMVRLLQGDVGSGKTVVACMAMLSAVEAGFQAALMAPTEILARQHAETIAPIATAAGVRMALLTGRDKGAQRKALLADLASGEIGIAVGTHALVQEDVAFRDMALAVVDEQHRFGVHQRVSLSDKGQRADLLVMTATPIPRTLLLAVYGDLEVSKLTEKPAGRQPIDTRIISLDRLDETVEGIRRAIAQGAQAFWVCPLVEESDEIDLAAATERYEHLRTLFGNRVGLVHGRLKAAEKDAVMADFAARKLDILVATTVIEVGVDVPSATIMAIEHAERFGLAQLHQLRGRVGRGASRSTCLLLYAAPLGDTAKARLAIMRDTEDGFRIAEEDLRLRGGGEILGTRQSGMPDFRLADLAVHADLLESARADVRLILTQDPELTGPRGRALRTLLYLFERDAAVRLLRSA